MGVELPGIQFNGIEAEDLRHSYLIALDGEIIDRGRIEQQALPTLVRRIEEALLSRLHDCFDYREFRWQLGRSSGNGSASISGWTHHKNVLCWRACRQLLRERVPLHDWSAIAEVCDASDESLEVFEVVRAIRRRMAAFLPGIADRQIAVPREWEADLMKHVRRQDDRRFLAMPREQAQDLLSRLRPAAGGETSGGVFVASPDARPFVQAFVTELMPGALVVSTEEAMAVRPRPEATSIGS